MDSRGKKRIFLAILLGIVAGIVIKSFLLDIIRIEGTSMEPALHSGQKVVINRLAYGLNIPFGDSLAFQWSKPRTGDIVIYLIDNTLVIKRCVATEDDLLEYSYKSGYNLTTGERDFPLTEEQYHNLRDCHSVPQGTILAIGDNCNVSIDSRNYGFVSVKNILGKVICKPTDF